MMENAVKLAKTDLTIHLIRIIENLRIKAAGNSDKRDENKRGVTQGSVLGHLLLNVYCTMIYYIRKCRND